MKQPKTIKIATLIVIIMTVMAFISIIFILKWAYQSTNILEIKNNPVPAHPAQVNDGDKIYLDIKFCKNSNLRDATEVNLIGDRGAKIGVNWPTGATGKMCTRYPDVPVPIPAQTPTDTYKAVFIVCYDINPLKKHRCTTFKSQPFQVVNNKLGPGDARVQE